jgi:hypothetical protein
MLSTRILTRIFRLSGVLARRKPLLLLRLSGLFLLRFADRQFLGLLFQEPPRNTLNGRPVMPDAGIPAATTSFHADGGCPRGLRAQSN